MTIAKPHYGKYLLVLSGSAESAPFLADWKVLKDDIRKNVRNPGWTDVSPTSREGIQRAWCNLWREGEAEATYIVFVLTILDIAVPLSLGLSIPGPETLARFYNICLQPTTAIDD
ncbi:hypothetical protein PtrEW4_010440, partial [Pyrenophora tritici-repentis]